MQKIFIFSILLNLLFVISCKEDTIIPVCLPATEKMAIDAVAIDNYLSENEISASIDPSGLRYLILAEGTGEKPSNTDGVLVKYKGMLLSNGSVFDQNSEGIQLPLTGVINGWRIGIPFIKEGGKILLYIPSILGYGCRWTSSKIPGNANLIFEVELISVL